MPQLSEEEIVNDDRFEKIPDDPEEIKRHIETHRQAVRMILAQLTMLNEHLRKVIGPVAYLQYQSEFVQSEASDLFGHIKEHNEQDG